MLQLSRNFLNRVPKAPLSHITPYVPPDTLNDSIKMFEATAMNVLKLDYNEATVPPPSSVVTSLTKYLTLFNGGLTLPWYPHLGGGKLLEKLSDFNGVKDSNIIITNGSDDALQLICQTFLESGVDSVLVPQPSYPQMNIYVLGKNCTYVPLNFADAFENDIEELRNSIRSYSPKICYLITPNNPTGTEWSPNDIQGLLEEFPDVLFVVDEAYIEFARIRENSVNLIFEFKNIIVTRTFSKCWGLAALRIGYLMADDEVIEELKKQYNPKQINELGQIAACAAIDEADYYVSYANDVCLSRDWLVQQLSGLGVYARSGGGNFCCVKAPNDMSTTEFLRKLEKHNIICRDIHGRFPGYIRITCGTSRQMQRVYDAIRSVIT